jgi:UDP-N-acetylmuramoylalanine--D-glutamate ligase
VLNADDAGASAMASRARGRVLWFSRRKPIDRGVCVRDGWIVARIADAEERIGPVSEVTLRGAHNLENVLAATACARWMGVAPDAIRRGIAAFQAVPHRI